MALTDKQMYNHLKEKNEYPSIMLNGCVDCDECEHRDVDVLCDISTNDEECPLVNAQKWQCYENGIEGIYSIKDLRKMWESKIDKNNFADFQSWIAENEKMQILIKIR